MNRHVFWTTVFAAIAVGFVVASARADIIEPTASSESDYYENQPASNCYGDGGGWAIWTKPNKKDMTTWTLAEGPWEGWMSADNADISAKWLLFDLGTPHNLGYVDLWNYWQSNSGGAARGIKDLVVWASDSSGAEKSVLVSLTGANCLPVETNGSALPDRRYSLTGGAGVRWVKLHVGSYQSSDNLGGDEETSGDGYVGLFAVRFESAVPEPGTLALLAAGLVGLLCYAWRKRK